MPPQLSKASGNKAQIIFARVVLLLSILAFFSTSLATTSEDVVYQVLSQKELVQASNATTTINKIAIVQEPYGYVFIKDDTGKQGYLRFLSQATFYEYRLPRAFLKISQHREKLTLKESKNLQFKAGVRKRPEGWDPSTPGRNIFIDEPYRNKVVDRLFKRSHQKLNISMAMGSLSILAILFIYIRISMKRENSIRCSKLCALLCSRPKGWIAKALSSPVWNGLWNRNLVAATFVVAIVGGLVMSSGTMSAYSITMLLFNDAFCGKQCASSTLESSDALEVDACIEGCVLGSGGKYAVVASCLWLLVLLLICAVVAISIIVSKAKSFPSLSRKRWWNAIFLPLAIRSDQLVDSAELPLTSNGNHQL